MFKHSFISSPYSIHFLFLYWYSLYVFLILLIYIWVCIFYPKIWIVLLLRVIYKTVVIIQLIEDPIFSMISLLKYDHCVWRNRFRVHLTIVIFVNSHGRRKQDVNVVYIYIFCIHISTHASPIYYFHASAMYNSCERFSNVDEVDSSWLRFTQENIYSPLVTWDVTYLSNKKD